MSHADLIHMTHVKVFLNINFMEPKLISIPRR
jgi:hypothetical protein